MIKFIYVGRLCKEKGCDLILDFFNSIDDIYIKQFSLDIYGDGVMRSEFEVLGQKMDNVTYHGYTKKQIILENWKTMDYTLMPSRFLETFGLSALDSFGVGVPVIGFQKGGLQQFGDCVIDIGDEENFSPLLYSLLENAIETKDNKLSKMCLQEFSKCSKKLWIERCRQNFGAQNFAGKKILLTSDYIVKLGGIETYILDVQELLQEQGAEVRLMGCATIRHGWKRYLAMMISLCNIGFGIKLKKEIDQRQPDIVRWHSVHRWIGWLPLRMTRNFSGKKVVMYHDFGLLHPFPSQVYKEEQLGYQQDLLGFIKESKKSGVKLLMRLPLLCVKRCSLSCIRKILRNMNIHLVPSSYMSKRIHKKAVDKRKIIDLPHFV